MGKTQKKPSVHTTQCYHSISLCPGLEIGPKQKAEGMWGLTLVLPFSPGSEAWAVPGPVLENCFLLYFVQFYSCGTRSWGLNMPDYPSPVSAWSLFYHWPQNLGVSGGLHFSQRHFPQAKNFTVEEFPVYPKPSQVPGIQEALSKCSVAQPARTDLISRANYHNPLKLPLCTFSESSWFNLLLVPLQPILEW